MTPDVDVETLRILVAVHELGSVSAAARRFGISQPAATGRIRAFEARWRLSVLKRTPRGSTMTTDGLAVVSWARSVLHATDTMRAGLQALSADRAGEVAVAASLTVAEFILPRWLGELHATMPEVHPRLHVVNSDTVADLVREAKVDVGFIETAARPVDLARTVVGSDRLIVVVSPGHPWARYTHQVAREALLAARWVLREPGSGTRSTFTAALRAEPMMAMEAGSTTALIGAAVAGVGPAVVSGRAVAGELETRTLVEVDTGLDLLRPLTAIWSDQVRPSGPVVELLRIAAATTDFVRD